ncbi:MAG TPA: phosphonate ABC transporter, permease protein PhnE [Spirochaetia bacterium]|nr:phosphonate ABC transporter, permease protein PhnE [Spirochaetia bacterium]
MSSIDLAADSTLDVFRSRRRQMTLVLLAIAVVVGASSVLTQFSYRTAAISVPKAVGWLVTNIIPDGKALEKLPQIVSKLLQTIVVSVMATVFATVFAFAFAILGSNTTRPHPAFSLAARAVGSLFRNIPVVAWAMVLLMSFGQSQLTGLLALFFATFGFLVRSFLETIDETSRSSVEALHAAGASWLQTVFQAVLPSVLPQVLSWMLYMVETNIRDATLVGILTGTGIGFTFDLYYNALNYRAAGLVVVSLVVVVLLIENVSNLIRRVIL